MKYWRHILFWIVYCSYFYIQSISPQSLEEFSDPKTYRNAFMSLYSFIPVCVLSVYISIYFILPRFIETRLYAKAILSFFVLFSAGAYINYLAAFNYYETSGVWTSSGKGAISLGYLNTVWAMIISGIAICIKITRKWFRQQKEIAAISRQKARNELNLQKNRMHPGFLYTSLDSIYAELNTNSGASSSMILLLSNLLSYSLYECKIERVTLQRELNAVADFVSLEKMKGSKEICVRVDENIDAAALLVSPMLILSVLHEGYVEAITVREDDENIIADIVMSARPRRIITVEKIYKQEYELA